MRGKCEREKDEGWMDASISSCNLRYLTGCQVGFRFSEVSIPKGISGAGFSFSEVSGEISGGFQVGIQVGFGFSEFPEEFQVVSGSQSFRRDFRRLVWLSGGFRFLGWASGCQGIFMLF